MRIKSSAEILFYVTRVSVEKDVHLMPKMCAFFIALVQFFANEGKYDEKNGLYYVQYSCRDFSRIFTQYSANLIHSSLQKFDECGLIKRVPVGREFRKLKVEDGFAVNKPYVTYLDLSVFIEE